MAGRSPRRLAANRRAAGSVLLGSVISWLACSALAAPPPRDGDGTLRPVRRLETEDGVTVLTNSRRDLEAAPARPQPVVPRPIPAPPTATLVLPLQTQPASASDHSSWWAPFALLAGLSAWTIVGLRRQRARRLQRFLDAAQTGEPPPPDSLPNLVRRLPPPAQASSAKQRGEASQQWVSQGPPSRRIRS